MKTQFGVILALMLISATAMAGSGTNAPAKKASAPKQAAASKPKAQTEVAAGAPFEENEQAIVAATTLNVRGQSHINSEIITRLKKGDSVTVQKEVTLAHPKTDEPARWAQIALPAGTHVWVSSLFLDTNQTVVPKKLNIRSGPGENYSVIGALEKGDTVKGVSTKGDWTEIEAPTNAYGFVAAHMLMHKEIALTTPIVSTITTTTVVETVPVPVATATETPTNAVTTNEQPVTPVVTPVVPTPLPTPAADEPPPRRIVQREGVVGDTVSIQAPTYFQLQSLDTGRTIDYLYSTSTNLALYRYRGKTVLVTGEESLDERWANTPVLTIQRIQVVSK